MPKSSNFGSPSAVTRMLAGFRVAMHHQVPVQVADSVAYLQKERNDLPYANPGSVCIEWFSLDVFHHQIGLAVFAMTRVEQPTDVGMRYGRQNLALREKAASQGGIVRPEPHEFHCNSLGYFSVNALRQMNGAHAAAAQ